MPTATKRAALYLRISEDKTGHGLAVARQREDTTRIAAQRGYQLIAEHTDNDISAAGRKKRPGFEALIQSIDTDSIDVVLSYSLDRLTRNRRDAVRLIESCQRHRVSLVLVRGSDIDMTSASGRLTAEILSSVSRHEIEQKSERQVRAQEQAMKEGRITGGPRPFGYRRGGMELDPVEAPLLAQAYERWLAGASLVSISDWLDGQGMRTTHGNRWRANTVRVVLANPRNAALRAMRPVVDEVSGRRSVWHDRPVANGVWPAVVSEEVWQASMARLRDPGRLGNGPWNQTMARGPKPRYLLAGIARCGHMGCGQHMITGSGGVGNRRLNCVSKRHINRRAVYVEAFVVEELLRGLSSDTAADLLLPVEEGPDLTAVRAEWVAKRERLRGLAQDYADGVLDREQVKVAGDELRSRLAELDQVVARAGQTDLVAPLVTADDPAVVWDSYPLATKRLVIDRLMVVTLYKAKSGRPPGGVYDTSTIKIRWRRQR